MKGNQKRIFPLIMVLQIFIISCAVMAIPAAATPDLPTILKGSVNLDGKLAPVGTEISVKLNGNELVNNMVTTEGENDGLPVSILSEYYPNLKFYVNGNEAKLVDATVLENADTEAAVLVVDLTATSPVSSNSNSNSNNGGGGSYSRTATTSDSDDDTSSGSTASVSSTGVDDTSLKSVAATTQPESTEDVPAPKTKTSIVAIVIGAIVLICIVAIVGYKLKEN